MRAQCPSRLRGVRGPATSQHERFSCLASRGPPNRQHKAATTPHLFNGNSGRKRREKKSLAPLPQPVWIARCGLLTHRAEPEKASCEHSAGVGVFVLARAVLCRCGVGVALAGVSSVCSEGRAVFCRLLTHALASQHPQVMSNASSELVWQIVRRSNRCGAFGRIARGPARLFFLSLTRVRRRFLVKGRTRVGAEFSSERSNLRNTNSFKYSGLTGNKAVGVDLTAGALGRVRDCVALIAAVGQAVRLWCCTARTRPAARVRCSAALRPRVRLSSRARPDLALTCLRCCSSGSRKKAFAAIDKAVSDVGRQDLKRSALARYNALHRGQQRGATKKVAKK